MIRPCKTMSLVVSTDSLTAHPSCFAVPLRKPRLWHPRRWQVRRCCHCEGTARRCWVCRCLQALCPLLRGICTVQQLVAPHNTAAHVPESTPTPAHDATAPAPHRWNIQWHWGSSGGGANHVDSASSGRAIVPQNKPAPKPKKKCDSACKKRNIRAALLNWRRKVAAARAWAKKVAAAKKYNARLRAARLAQRARQGRKLLRASA